MPCLSLTGILKSIAIFSIPFPPETYFYAFRNNECISHELHLYFFELLTSRQARCQDTPTSILFKIHQIINTSKAKDLKCVKLSKFVREQIYDWFKVLSGDLPAKHRLFQVGIGIIFKTIDITQTSAKGEVTNVQQKEYSVIELYCGTKK